ncbi:MAG TPA: glycosyltransferase family 4 protein [Bacteroidia bacterium]|jgi:glycosyltransferase involved in cell wall biosynthesis
MKRILFIASHRKNRSPSQRFRFEQYFDHLREQNFECHLSNLLTEEDDKRFYSSGSLTGKVSILLRSFFKRMKDVKNAKNYDLIFVQREAFMTGSTFFERRLRASGKKMVFDFDDSIWILDTSKANKKWEWLKNPQKTAKIIALSDMVFAGNAYLGDYAKQFNSNVRIIPTTIDTKEYKRAIPARDNKSVCIGWSGSITTIKHFEYALPFLSVLKKKYGERISIKVIGDGSYVNNELGIKGIPWIKEDEIKELSSFDIGIMPLPNDEWTKGKCGLKGLQYMALEIPTIMSPVGVNTNIIQDGVNGFLAATTEEWTEKISQLVDSFELRQKIGAEGKKTVDLEYSVESQKQNYTAAFNELIAR